MVYDAAGRQIATVDPLEHRNTSVYDAAGRTIAAVNPLTFRTTTVYDPANQPIASIDPLARRSTTVYDPAGRNIASINPLEERTTSVYDAAGQMIASIDPLQRITTTLYDAAGRTVVLDDFGYGDLGCYGSTVHQTPHIDRLAQGGMRFTDFHSNGPVCSPTRAALLTGQYQQRSGVESAIGFNLVEGMPLAKTTIAEVLKPAGYRCGVFGKWHVGHVSRFGPKDQGFDVSYCANNSPDYHSHVSRSGQIDWFKDQQLADEPGYLTDLVTQHAQTFIRNNRERPFFAYISHLAVHFPFQGPGDPPHRAAGKNWDAEKYGPLPPEERKRAYRDMVHAVDDSVGRIVNTLEELRLREHTLIFLTSDNGAYKWIGSSGPFLGQKGRLTEGGHRVPAIANWPGRIPAAAETHATAMTMDVLPTLVALAGIAMPEGLELDGEDISRVLLRNAPMPERILFWRFPASASRAARRGPWKLLVEKENVQLFNLSTDPGEKTNLAVQQPERVKQLQAELAAWESRVAPPSSTRDRQ